MSCFVVAPFSTRILVYGCVIMMSTLKKNLKNSVIKIIPVIKKIATTTFAGVSLTSTVDAVAPVVIAQTPTTENATAPIAVPVIMLPLRPRELSAKKGIIMILTKVQISAMYNTAMDDMPKVG